MTTTAFFLRTLRTTATMAALLALSATAQADSVAQIATAVRISRATATLIDPQGRPGMATVGGSTTARPGDILTFIAHFTPVPNGGTRGLGGYVTYYIPRNVEVVGARVVDSTGATIAPTRGGLAADGYGPRGARPGLTALEHGSLSQLYADTGIFYSTDRRTNRVPSGAAAGETFLTLENGILLNPATTAAGGLADLLGSVSRRPDAHNRWDAIQAYAFGIGSAVLGTGGKGVTPDRYGSPVAGPGTWYNLEASNSGAFADPVDAANVVDLGSVGPWRRIQTFGAEIGRRGNTPPMPDPGLAVRVGVPAVDASGAPLGRVLDASSPLPSYDPTTPGAYTRAVRFAVGELVVGREYLSELSVRVLDIPLDPVSGTDTICAEVFGGDRSAQVQDGTSAGKDNAWRYFFPAPACVSLDLLFDLDVNKLVALPGDRLVYTITGKNLATTPHHATTVTHCFVPAEASYVSSTPMGTVGTGAGCPDPANQDSITWNLGLLDPGEEFTLTARFDARGGGNNSTVGRAIFTSTELPAPGFSTVAFTTIDPLAVPALSLSATPDFVPTVPADVSYRLAITNNGTDTASFSGCRNDPCRVILTLPSPFFFRTGTARMGGAAIADPAVAGRVLTFTAGLADIAPGATQTLSFSAGVPATTADGLYRADVETWTHDVGQGSTVNDALAQVAEVAVGTPRSDSPTLTTPIFDSATSVCGTTTEAALTTITLFVAGVAVGTAVSDAAGAFCVPVGGLFPGQHVSATARAPGELESLHSTEEVVSSRVGVTACSNGVDDDGDGLVDFPDDPDCMSPMWSDEAHVPACADGVDNDLDGFADFGEDPGCRSLLDDEESGGAECSNGADDDADGLVDFPDDPGCTSADDVSELDVPACANGLDDDGDGLVDYPLDDGCASALDGDEVAMIMPRVDAGADAGTDAGADAGTDAGIDAGTDAAIDMDGGGVLADAAPRPDPGGVNRPGDGGCGCRVGGESTPAPRSTLLLFFGLAAAFLRRRRR